MNKAKLRITGMDAKRCQAAIMAVKKLANHTRQYPCTITLAAELTDRLNRLKVFYASMNGITLRAGMEIPFRVALLRDMQAEATRLYAYAYPRGFCDQWRSEIVKPLALTEERVRWLIGQKVTK